MTDWPFEPPLATMEAKVRTTFPEGGWAYEPKWDGFRVLCWSGDVRMDSRSQKPLLRYFPELDSALRQLPTGTVVDGEVVVVRSDRTDFDALQNRLHPAESRVRMLSEATPAELIAFDLLAIGGEDLRSKPFSERRAALATLGDSLHAPWHMTPSTHDVDVGKRWFEEYESAGCDGIVAKELTEPYRSGERAMAKIKHRRSVDVVVGGYRLHKKGDRIGSLLLGLFQGDQLHFIGHCSGFPDTDRVAILERLRAYEADDEGFGRGVQGQGVQGQGVRRPGGVSRWTGDKDLSWVSLRPELVAEVSYDQLTGDRFRHATRFERWRPDKESADCTMEQLQRPEGPLFTDVVQGGDQP